MGLKFLSLLFLLVAAAYAAPAFDEDELDDSYTAEEIDDAMDDEGDVEDPLEDESDEEEDPARKKKPRYDTLFGTHSYCACRRPLMKGDPEEDDSSKDTVADHIERITSDVQLSDPKSKKSKSFKASLIKLIKPFFRSVRLNCACTKNRAVVRLLRYLKVAAVIARRQKLAFWRHVRVLIALVKYQRKG